MNLLDTVKGYLGDETIGRIASAVGIDPSAAKAAVGAAAPTLLAGVAQTANAGRDGARRVAAAVDAADDGALEGGATAWSAGDATSAAQGGMATVSKLLGGNAASGIVDAISRYTGLGGGAAGKVIGMIAPLVLGAIKRQKTSMGLDAGGLANLLSSQKSSFLSAIPAGLSGILSSVPGLSGLAGMAGGAAATTREYATSAAGDVRDAGYRAAEGVHHHAARSSYGWVVPAAICALLAIGLWWWMGHREEAGPRARVPQQPAPTVVTPATPATPAAAPEETATPAGARIGPGAAPAAGEAAAGLSSRVSDIFSSATNTFGQVHDAASAEAAGPKVDAINKQLDALAQSAKTMPTGTREALSTTIRQWRDKLQPVTDKALATPGVGGELRPKVDDMYRKMDALMMAQ